ncbi:DNA-binding MarR family transcriptional regulator [Neomicrococcus aestuarii]|uniref:DNA-binding MarR family transcriptional regulator n=1 Tax=Neomicrococcus aestuarii TaxID=556325 RepID=A0A7W8WZ84_9MICC|nr:MarR family transcriptional regulator [Neomicrococcus aestuarii]MBB5513081.1 DNA-binding MarR family transcriptional regulator [Neomicrococcus aestuarii]
MPHDSLPHELMTRSFYEALYPFSLRFNSRRTLSPGKLGVLRHLAEHGRASTTELAAVVQVSQQAISLATKELEHLGFTARIPDDDDRRRTWITLTEAGQQKLTEELDAGVTWLQTAIQERLSNDERAILRAAIPVLQKLGSEAADD